jgi:hypothetical protein
MVVLGGGSVSFERGTPPPLLSPFLKHLPTMQVGHLDIAAKLKLSDIAVTALRSALLAAVSQGFIYGGPLVAP